jgi:hypothetical protein
MKKSIIFFGLIAFFGLQRAYCADPHLEVCITIPIRQIIEDAKKSFLNHQDLTYKRSINSRYVSYVPTKDAVSLCSKLDTILYHDQIYRHQLNKARESQGFNSQEEAKLWLLINSQDSVNLNEVEVLIGRYGWSALSKTCKSAGKALFYVIQHANLSVQLKYLPYLKNSLKDGTFDISEYAFLIDRINMRTGKPQVYGTQTNILDNICYAYPISDAKNVNLRRKEAKLPSIETYFKNGNVRYEPLNLTARAERERDSIMAILNVMYDEEQGNIKHYIDTLKKYGKGSNQEVTQRNTRLQIANSLVQGAKRILDKFGWPGYNMIGIPGSTTLFLVMYQADAKTLQHYLPLLKKQAISGEASLGYVAAFTDKIEVGNGRPQIYGTQVDSSRRQPYLIKEEQSVDVRRKGLGLPPLSEYLKQTYGIDYPPKVNNVLR